VVCHWYAASLGNTSTVSGVAGAAGLGASVGDLGGYLDQRLGSNAPPGTQGYLACTNRATGAGTTRLAAIPAPPPGQSLSRW